MGALRRPSPPIIWGGLTLVFWCLWGWLGFLPLHRADRHLTDQRLALGQERATAMAQLAAVPSLVARSGSISLLLQRTVAPFPKSAGLTVFLDSLTALANGDEVATATAAPTLASLMDLPSGDQLDADTSVVLDTVEIELAATGSFGGIGAWLDCVEARPGFQRWQACEWSRGEIEGIVGLSGRAAFWVQVTPELSE